MRTEETGHDQVVQLSFVGGEVGQSLFRGNVGRGDDRMVVGHLARVKDRCQPITKRSVRRSSSMTTHDHSA